MRFERINLYAGNISMLPDLLNRSIAFAKKYDSDATPEHLMSALFNEAYRKDFAMCGYLVFDCDNNIIGHCIASIDQYYGSRWVYVLQAEATSKIATEMMASVLEDIEEWGRLNGCSDVRIAARNRAVAKLFNRKFKFEESERRLMKKAIN